MSALRYDLIDIAAGVRFFARLPGLLTLQIDPAEPLERLRDRFRNREANFLERVRDVAYALPDSPYALLFAWAGYEYNDVVSLVEKEGLEDALQALYHPGIYLSFEELRGTVPVQRGSLTLQVGLDQLVNPRIARGLLIQRGARNRVTGIRLDKEAFRRVRPPLRGL